MVLPRMYMDYKDLNNACPTHCLLFPNINQLEDSTSDHNYLCIVVPPILQVFEVDQRL